ncbi:MAG: T9SS type A sorting domain-containing protein [Saprospiraceae bacterium]|nr:T9SS type A sorting domain-containing protein [Saprospiraceae bacterium]
MHIFTNVTEGQWTGTKIYNFLYNQNQDTISITETNSNADSTYIYRLDEFQYNSSNKKEFWCLKNKYGKFKTEYYYYNDGKLERSDEYYLVNGEYKGSRRFSYTYNADNKIEEIKIYSYSQSTQTWTFTSQYDKFEYTDTSNVRNTYYGGQTPGRIFKELFNHQGQIVVFQEENYSNVVNKFNTTKLDSTYYNSDGSLNRIVRKEGNLHAQDNILILVTSDEYRYKKPDINSTNSTLLATSISVFPNPASESVTLTLPDDLQVYKATLYTASGLEVNQYIPSSTTLIIEKQTKSAGIYYLKLTTNEGIVTKPIVFLE